MKHCLNKANLRKRPVNSLYKGLLNNTHSSTRGCAMDVIDSCLPEVSDSVSGLPGNGKADAIPSNVLALA